jgi:hypothetical protein
VRLLEQLAPLQPEPYGDIRFSGGLCTVPLESGAVSDLQELLHPVAPGHFVDDIERVSHASILRIRLEKRGHEPIEWEVLLAGELDFLLRQEVCEARQEAEEKRTINLIEARGPAEVRELVLVGHGTLSST